MPAQHFIWYENKAYTVATAASAWDKFQTLKFEHMYVMWRTHTAAGVVLDACTAQIQFQSAIEIC